MADVLEVPKEEKVALDKAEKEARDKALKEKAQGPIFGGKVDAKSASAADVQKEVYDVGYTPLVVKCTRGEQKAEVGDVGYKITVHDEATGIDKDYIFIIPGPVVQFLVDATSPIDGMTVQSYGEYEKKRTEDEAKRLGKLPRTEVLYTKERPEGINVLAREGSPSVKPTPNPTQPTHPASTHNAPTQTTKPTPKL